MSSHARRSFGLDGKESVPKVDFLQPGRGAVHSGNDVSPEGLLFEIDVIQKKPYLQKNQPPQCDDHEDDKQAYRVLCELHCIKYTHRLFNRLADLTLLNNFSHILTWFSGSFSES